MRQYYIIAKINGVLEIELTEGKMTYERMCALVHGTVEYYEENGITYVFNENGISECPINHFTFPTIEKHFFGNVIIGKTIETPDESEFHGFTSIEEASIFFTK